MPARDLATRVHAEPIQCALHNRVLGLSRPDESRIWRGVLLTSGTGVIENGDAATPLQAPCLAWVPWVAGQALRVRAGCVGFQFTIGDQVLANAIGHNPESADLRHFLDRQVVAGLDDAADADAIADAAHAFGVIVREVHGPRVGSWTMVQAQVRAILVTLWRLSEGAGTATQPGRSSRVLREFRQLLEAHFRDRWPVRGYADALGVSADRLHDICRRELGRPPLQLVHERLAHEARLRLERSSETVEQVADSLGFRDVGHFSRFFKAKVGMPPGRFRDQAALAADEGRGRQPSTYADWP